jgi:prepilin-type N-terminal cleavage/methylation domain-containing protein
MRSYRHRAAFTLVELLIVVVILAILAATIIPQFTDATADTKKSTGLTNLRTLRQQIEYYKAQHAGKAPDAALAKLLIKTDVDGNAGTDFGPYFMQLPQNPFTNSSKVTATTDNPPTAASSGSDRGWLYNATTGNVWLDEAGYLDK